MFRRCVAAVCLLLGLAGPVPQVTATSSAYSAAVDDRGISGGQAAPVARDQRIVWDAKLYGMELYSARLDGTDRVRLWLQPKGDADNLVLSPDERRVAFSPGVKRGRSARLVAVSTLNGHHRDLLPSRSEIVGIGPLGWSPNGRRIVFQGFVNDPAGDNLFYPSYLYSVSSNGGGLRRGRMLSDGTDNGAVFGSILVTARGIVYPDDDTVLRFPSLTAGKPVVIARRAYNVYPTGNGKWLYFRHITKTGKQSLRKVRPDGRGQRIVIRYGDDLQDLFLTYAPDTTGRRLLLSRDDPDTRVGYETVVLDNNTMAATELAFARGTSALTW